MVVSGHGGAADVSLGDGAAAIHAAPASSLRRAVFDHASNRLEAEEVHFGVVLIERGHEVGGGEQRFRIGTIAEVQRITAGEGFVDLKAGGTERIEVVEWLEDAPHPRAEVGVLSELVWDASLKTLRDRADGMVRRTVAIASDFADDVWPADIELSDDPGRGMLATGWHCTGDFA